MNTARTPRSVCRCSIATAGALGLVMIAGCAGEALNGPPTPECTATTKTLAVLPATLQRNEPTAVEIRWTVSEPLAHAGATLTLGSGIEVLFELLPEADNTSSAWPSYFASHANPFGEGATPGQLDVMAHGTFDTCSNIISATTSIELR